MAPKALFLPLSTLIQCLPQLCDDESAPGAPILRARVDVFAAADVVNGSMVRSVGVIDFMSADNQQNIRDDCTDCLDHHTSAYWLGFPQEFK